MQDFFQLQRFTGNNHTAPYGFLSRDDKDQIDTLLNTERDIRVDLSKKTVVDINTPGDFTLGIQNTLPVDSGGTGVGNLDNITVGGATRDASGHVLTTYYAPLDSPALTGSPTANTATEGDSSTRIATTAFVTRAIKTLIGTAPEILDTLGEIASAINQDADVYKTLNEAKQPKHAALTSISGLSTSANQMIYTTASNTYTTTSLTAYARTLLDDADAATARNTLDVPSKSGSGASGTWGISISGTAAKATADANGATIASTYMKLSGGTFTGAVTFANNTFNTVGDDVQFADFNVTGTLGIRGVNGTTGLALLKKGSTTDYALLSYNGANLISSKAITASLSGNATSATTATTAGNVTGVVAIANGGTNATTAAAARQNLFGAAMNTSALAKYVITINDSWANGGYTTLQQLRNFMGLGDTTSYLPVANGGTGANSLANITVGKASQLATARTISLTGAIIGSGTFDGSGDLTITTSEPIHSFTGNGYYDIGGIVRTSGGTDYARVRFGQTASDSGYLEIAVADDGNEPIYVRQYKHDLQSPAGDPNTTDGAFKYIYRTITLLDANGNSSFPGTITAAGFSGNATNVTGTISIAHGGTGATTAAAARTALGAAAESHGNHVPAVQTASNKVFLRNDNSWQEVTPANIGAAAAVHTHDYATSSHNHAASDIASGILSTTRGGTGNANGTIAKLTTARSLKVSLSSSSAVGFDGSTNVTTIGVGGVLSTLNGGTGNSLGAAIKATQDADGNVISSTYLKLSGGTVTGDLSANSFKGLGAHYFGTCATASATADKVVTCSGFKLAAGAVITINFSNAITTDSITLNVNSTGAYPVSESYNSQSGHLYDTNSPFYEYFILANNPVTFIFSGTYWVLQHGNSTATELSTGLMNYPQNIACNYLQLGRADTASMFYGYSATAGATAAKVVYCPEIDSDTLLSDFYIVIKFDANNTAGVPTLNINSTGAFPIRGRTVGSSAVNTYFRGTITYIFKWKVTLQSYVLIRAFEYDAKTTWYVTCNTAAGTAAKVADLDDIPMNRSYVGRTGERVILNLTVNNTASNPTLSINRRTARAIYYGSTRLSGAALKAGIYDLVNDGTNWQVISMPDEYLTKAEAATITSDSAAKLSTARSLKVSLSSSSAVNFDGSANVTTIGVGGVLSTLNGGTGNSLGAAAKLTTAQKLKVSLSSSSAVNFDGSANVTTIGVGGILPVANGGTGNSLGTAAKLSTARSLKVSLSSSSAVNFDGSANVTTIGIGGILPIANGGTNASTAAAARTALGAAAADHTHSDYAATSHTHGAGDITSGTLSIPRGGTGATTAAAARTALGAAASNHTHSNYAATSHTHGAGDITSGILSIANGGTNASTAAEALTNLGAAATSHTHGAGDITSGTLSVARGGTGATTAAAARTALGAAASSHTHSNYAATSHTHTEYAALSGAAFTGSISNSDNATLGNMNYGQVKLVPNTNGSVYIGSSSNTSANGSQFYDYSRDFYAGDIAGSKINIGCKSGSSIQVGRSSNSTVNMGASSARIELGQTSSTIGVGDYANTHITIGASGSQIHLNGTAYYNGTPLGSGGSSSSYYGVCSTAATTSVKTVSVDSSFSLTTGVLVTVTFSNVINVTGAALNVNSTGSKPIRYRGYAIPAGAIEADSTYTLVYDGTYWVITGSIISTS